MTFELSLDEEHVRWLVHHRGALLVETAQVLNYLLLTLARERLRERGDGVAPASEQGWVYRDDLCRMLAIDPAQINLHVFRARKVLSRVGVAGASSLVERRSLTQQLRFGTDRVQVVGA